MVMEAAEAAQAVQEPVSSIDTARSAILANFDQNDLDVPAFLRKRGEVM
jgi:hypothetical protein